MMPIDSNQTRHNQVQLDYYENRDFVDNKRVAVKSTPYVNNHLAKFLDFSNLDSGGKTLDIGCGMGKYTIPLAESGYDLDALDLSPKLLGELKCQAKGRADITTICGDILNPEHTLIGKYDHVVGFFMLHHLIDLQKAATEIARLLKPGGRVTFLEPNPYCLLFYLQITLAPTMSWKAEKGILNLTKKNMTRCFESAGFSDIKFNTFGILPPVLRNTSVGRIAETAYDRIAPLRPFSAFQLTTATLN